MDNDPDTAIIRTYRCWMPQSSVEDAKRKGMSAEFIEVATSGVDLKVALASDDPQTQDEEEWEALACSQMMAHMSTHYNQPPAGEIIGDWFDVERIDD